MKFAFYVYRFFLGSLKCRPLAKYGCGVRLGQRVTLGHLTQRNDPLLGASSALFVSGSLKLFRGSIVADLVLQSRCYDRCTSYWRNVLGFHQCYEEKPSTELRPASEQYPRRTRYKIYPEASAQL